MISRPIPRSGNTHRWWQKYLPRIAIALVVGVGLACSLGIILIWTLLPDPRLAAPPPPTQEPIPATTSVVYAAEGYSLAAEKARAWKQQACLADVLALYDWTGTEWKAAEFTYHFLNQHSEQLMKIRIKPEDNVVEVYRPFSLSANTSIPDHCLRTPPDQWQEKQALDAITQMLKAELTATCGEVGASMDTFELLPSFAWGVRIGAGITKQYILADLLFYPASGEIHFLEKPDPDTPCE